MADYDVESQAFLVEQALASAAFQQASDNRPGPVPDTEDGFEFRPRPLSHARTEPSAMLRELAAAEGHALQDNDKVQTLGKPSRRPPLPPSLSPVEAPSLSAKAQEGRSLAAESSLERQDTPVLIPPPVRIPQPKLQPSPRESPSQTPSTPPVRPSLQGDVFGGAGPLSQDSFWSAQAAFHEHTMPLPSPTATPPASTSGRPSSGHQQGGIPTARQLLREEEATFRFQKNPFSKLASFQKDGALDSLNLELGTIAAASPKAGLELGALLRQPSVEGSTGAREVLKRSMAGDLHVGDLERTSPYRLAQGQATDLPTAEEAEEKAGGLARSPTIKTLGDDLEFDLEGDPPQPMLLIWLLVLLVEATLFKQWMALYFLAGTKKHLFWLLSAVLFMPLFIGCFSQKASTDATWHDVYIDLEKVIACIILFCFANVLKKIFSQLMSTQFHKEAHFAKMQDALRKEHLLNTLSEPRQDDRLAGPDAPAAIVDADRTHSVMAPILNFGKKSLAKGPTAGATADRSKSVPTQLPTVESIRAHEPPSANPSQGSLQPRGSHMTGKSGMDWSADGGAEVTLDNVTGTLRQPGLGRQVSNVSMLSQVLGSHAGPQHLPGQGPSRQNSRAGSMAGRPPLPRRDSVRSNATFRSHATARTRFAPAHMRSMRSEFKARQSKLTDRSNRTQGKNKLMRAVGFRATAGDGKSVAASTVPLPLPEKKTSNQGELIAKMHLVEKHIRKNKLQMTYQDRLGQASNDTSEVSSKNEAKKLAFYLFWNIKPFFDRTYILPEDLEHFYMTPKEAREAFEMLDISGDGQITLAEIRDSIVSIYRERRNLAMTLKDTKTVVNKIERILGVLLHIVFIFFYLLIFNVDLSQVWITLTSVVVAFSFIFKTAASNLYQSVMFLFAIHPLDVGDALLIDTVYYKVEEIALVNIVLRRWDGARIWYPTTAIISIPLLNLTRSNNKWEFFQVYLDFDTPASVLETVEEQVSRHLDNHPKEFSGAHNIFHNAIGNPLKLRLGIFFEYNHTGVDLGRTGHARSDLFLVISNTLAELRVDYSLPGFVESPTDMDSPPAPSSEQIKPLPSLSQPLPQIPEAAEPPQPEALQSLPLKSDAAPQPSDSPRKASFQPSVQLRRPLPMASESVLLQRRSSPIDVAPRGGADDRRRRVLPKSPFQTVQGSPP
ncbi:hypothetical protein WJX84_010731 [Apatococcus fuscideae]|uniref:EF-hand domain-containing protein n=1 Tax=Apatococcus fuscideae TaxID=2026836 RepID=A0AAW1T572_9CHLO